MRTRAHHPVPQLEDMAVEREEVPAAAAVVERLAGLPQLGLVSVSKRVVAHPVVRRLLLSEIVPHVLGHCVSLLRHPHKGLQ